MISCATELNTGVYVIRNFFGGEEYIGSALQGFRRRWNQHLQFLRKGTHSNWFLQTAWNYWGEGALQFSILERCPRESCIKREQKWMMALNPEYNICKWAACPMTGRKHSDATKRKMSEARSGEKNGFFGRKHSPETMAHFRQVKMGKKYSEESRKKVSASLMGNKRTLGRKASPEERAARKLLFSNPEIRLRMSIGRKKAWDKRKTEKITLTT